MLDFLFIKAISVKKGIVEVTPRFIIGRSSDLMIRGGDFYAIWIEDAGRWSTDEEDVVKLIDRELDKYVDENRDKLDGLIIVKYMRDSSSGSIDAWHKYCQKQLRDNYHMLDEVLMFTNSPVSKTNYSSKKLPYAMEDVPCPAWNKLIGTLYSEEERHKIEWAIGSIFNGDSKTLQKFLVFYGAAGTGKSTILNIIEKLFEGYYTTFDAKALGSNSSQFALEPFRCNPLVAIQHDGDLSKIEDNTRINSLVSHEQMTVNEKYKTSYASSFKAFLFMGTNRPVRITDAKSGLLRRLIDVTPSGEKIPHNVYRKLMNDVNFELGGIATHCKKVYESAPDYYDNYVPLSMLSASNDFYNFVLDNYHEFKRTDGVSLKQAWDLYNTYCSLANVPYKVSLRVFKEELKNYFREFKDRYQLEDGTRVRSWYSGFKAEKFERSEPEVYIPPDPPPSKFIFTEQPSVLDEAFADCPAQYANSKGTPTEAWSNVVTTLKDLDTKKLHWVKVPDVTHIMVDFDIGDEDGNKSFEKNLEAAEEFPITYAELSKSGAGIHLHYIYTGDPNDLNRVYKPEKYGNKVEIKVYSGNSALRRCLTKCNNEPIAVINSGLPLREKEAVVINQKCFKTDKSLLRAITKQMNRDTRSHAGTKPSFDLIKKMLDDAYDSGLKYDLSDIYTDLMAYALSSTNNSKYCLKILDELKLKSYDEQENQGDADGEIVFFDCEVFPNLFLINYKFRGKPNMIRLINPSSDAVEELFKYKLVGYNNRRYDNHIMYARSMGYSNEQLFILSQKLVKGDRSAFFGNAYNLSYTDIYDFASEKKSLKKWEIELGLSHVELGLPWDKPVPESMWARVSEYCDNDVISTEKVFEHLESDFVAREILADIAGMTVNDTTNSLTTRIIFGDNKTPQNEFNYRDMGDMNCELEYPIDGDEWTVFNKKTKKPIFPYYKYKDGKSEYRGIDPSEGGRVYAEQGLHLMVALLDIASMHPSSIIAEELFGERYTKRFADIVQIRLCIKHGEYEEAKKLFDGKLAKYLDDPSKADKLAKALKIAINSVYGLTKARFTNAFRDERNEDNIVAKRGALFMINLQHEVQMRGYTVAHIKTDSIKIPNADMDIINFVTEYGKLYGYTFEHEATYEKMCLVNDAVYIAKYATADICNELYGYVPADNIKHFKKHNHPWTATGTQFQIPYVFKTLFSKEDITFDDLCVTQQTTSDGLYLDNNELKEQFTPEDKKELAKIDRWLNAGKFTEAELPAVMSRKEELEEKERNSHNYIFIGRVGRFTPVLDGSNGGALYTYKNNKFNSANGTKGYRWMESETLKNLKREDSIDYRYFDELVNDAIASINKYTDFEEFAA